MREQLLKRLAAGVRREPVEIPGYGTVLVRGLTGEEYDRYEAATVRRDGDDVTHQADRGLLVLLAAEEAPGKPLFAEADLPALRAAPLAFLKPICEQAIELSGAGKAEMERIEKN